MRCLIFAGGDLHDPHWHLTQVRDGDFVIGVDKGAEHVLSLGLNPHLVIGDMDSISHSAKEILVEKEIHLKSFPGEKDETDTELALMEAINLEPEEIIIFAGTGDRLDHFLANLFLLVGYLPRGIPTSIATPSQKLWITDKSTKIIGYPGQTVSLLALSQAVKGLTLRGFYYPLEQAVLQLGFPRGISNVMVEDRAEVEFTEGILLVVQKNDTGDCSES